MHKNRYLQPRPASNDLLTYEEDLDSSYFRRKPTSFLSGSNDAKRYTWMPSDDESVRLEGPRPICNELIDMNRGPYVVGTYPSKLTYLSQSTEQLNGLVICFYIICIVDAVLSDKSSYPAFHCHRH